MKFCALCGAPQGEVPKQVPYRPHPYDIVGDDFVDVIDEDDLYFFTNHKGGPRDFHSDHNEEVHEDLLEVDRAAEIKWFEERYADQLQALREAYDNVTVRWGLHQYFF